MTPPIRIDEIASRAKDLQGTYVLIIFPDGWLGKPFDNLYRIDSLKALNGGISIGFDSVHAIEIAEISRFDASHDGLFIIDSDQRIVVRMKEQKIYPHGRVSIIYGDGLDVPQQIELAKLHFDS